MKKDFQKKKLNLNKKTIIQLNSFNSSTIMVHGGATTTNCPTYMCDTDTNPTSDPFGTMTPATKCIGGTVPLSKCNTLH